MKLKYKTLLVLTACMISFFLGRLTTKPRETVKYVKGETVTQTIEVPKYITSVVPVKPILPVKQDTVYINKERIVVQTVDTGAIIQNYISERRYAFNVFDNEYGKMDVRQTVQYNEIADFSYRFTPTQKVTTQQKERVFIPFASVSYNSFNQVGTGGGIFYRNVGFEYQYIRDIKQKYDGHGIGIKIKF